MDLFALAGGSEMIRYGNFTIKNPENELKEYCQIKEADFVVEIKTGLSTTPKKIICLYIDDIETIGTTHVSIFFGNATGNGYNGTGNNNASQAKSESISFTSADAKYLRYDEVSSKLYLHVVQWSNIKTGLWLWIAIYS